VSTQVLSVSGMTPFLMSVPGSISFSGGWYPLKFTKFE
jgi:hypothetical protein